MGNLISSAFDESTTDQASVSGLQWKELISHREPGSSQNTIVCRSASECDAALQLLMSQLDDPKCPAVLGLDCEWVPEGSYHYSEALAELEDVKNEMDGNIVSTDTVPKIALAQLSNLNGLSILIPTRFIQTPTELLGNILCDASILKTGVGIAEDARRINLTWGVQVSPFIDLRFLYSQLLDRKGKNGLAAIAESLFEIAVNKNPKITRSNWGAKELSDDQISYAAQDAQLSVDCFWMIACRLLDIKASPDSVSDVLSKIIDLNKPYLDFKYKNKNRSSNKAGTTENPGRGKPHKLPRLKKPLYSNIRLEAPDGQVLGFIDAKKSNWYVNQDLAELHPPTIVDGNEIQVLRLKIEPSKRPNKESDLYYMILRENACFVCGEKNNLLRKNIVPRQYRKFFPDLMKTHRSHDIALLCIVCHEKSCIFERRLTLRYAVELNAPLHPTQNIVSDDRQMRKLKGAAKALLYQRERMPENRIRELEQLIADNYSSTISDQVLEELLGMEGERKAVEEKEEESHGYRVVEEMKRREGGLPAFERAWRQQFLDSMKPEHLPALWSLDHNKERYRELVQ